jgi:hypothetical protein
VSTLGRRVGIGVTYALAVGRLTLAMASVAAARSPAPPPPEVVPPRQAHVDDPPAPAAVAAPEPSADAWRSDLRSMTTVLVCATLVLLAVTAMVFTRG